MMKALALLPRGLRAKFIAAFSCMSILPFLVCVYIVTVFVFPFAESIWLTSSIILLTMIVALYGFHIMQGIVESIVSLSREATRLVERTGDRPSFPHSDDEVGAIKRSLTALAGDVERMSLQIKQLEIRDKRLGIYRESYMRENLAEELKRAALFQRPCALLAAVFKNSPAVEKILADEEHNLIAVGSLAAFMRRFTGGIQKLGRFGKSGICVILQEHSRQQALALADKMRSELNTILWGELEALGDWHPDVVFGVATSPMDGLDAESLLRKCSSLV